MGCCLSTPEADVAAPQHDPGPQGSISPTDNTPEALRERLSRAQTTRLKTARPWRAADSNAQSSRSAAGPWTGCSLRRERSIFFDTRVTGRPEIWQAIRLAVEMARESGDLQGAYSVLNAAGCSVPRGRIEDGVWDESGVLYSCPPWVVSNPVDLDMQSEEADTDLEHRTAAGHSDGAGEAETDEDEKERQDLGQRRSEKGKGKGKDLVKVRGRLSDRGTDIMVQIEKNQTVRSIIQAMREEANISPGIKVKIAYLGKMLRETDSLEAQGWKIGHVLNVMVFQT